MELKPNIFIHGQIGSWFGSNGIEVVDLIAQVEKVKDAPELVVEINSPGGITETGFAMHDYLRSVGKPIATVLAGQCCSIATVVGLAGDKGKRFAAVGTDYLIHNPFLDGVTGDAEELQRAADFVAQEEKRLIDFYNKAVGVSKQGLDAVMKNNSFLDLNTVKELGFIDEILADYTPQQTFTKLKAVAISTKFNTKNEQMTKAEIEALQNEQKTFKSVLKALAAKVGIKFDSKNIDIVAADGTVITVVTEAAAPAVGDMVNIDGAPAVSGTYALEDGSTIVTDADGKISSIVPAPAPADVVTDITEGAMTNLKKVTFHFKDANGKTIAATTDEAGKVIKCEAVTTDEVSKSEFEALKKEHTETMAMLKKIASTSGISPEFVRKNIFNNKNLNGGRVTLKERLAEDLKKLEEKNKK